MLVAQAAERLAAIAVIVVIERSTGMRRPSNSAQSQSRRRAECECKSGHCYFPHATIETPGPPLASGHRNLS
jgi:hypothetical protein